jgi:cytochrome b
MNAAPQDNVYPLWDLTVRSIHWIILVLLPASWWTAREGYLEVHQWLGLTIMVLVLTRLVWGFLGSPQARFRDFLRGPRTVLAYFRGSLPTRRGTIPPVAGRHYCFGCCCCRRR